MFQGSRRFKCSLILIATAVLCATGASAQIEPEHIFLVSPLEMSLTSSESSKDMYETANPTDPLNSPHPVPWNWVMDAYSNSSSNRGFGLRYYRSPSLISPDGRYAAYSRIKMRSESDLFRSRVTSVMFLEDLQTGDLTTITASSPLADNPLDYNEAAHMPGAISILIPVSWSENGESILSRQFEGIFSTSEASDYAVVWNRNHNTTTTISPEQVNYTNAVLLGWSQADPGQVLFRAGNLGEENWPVWAVNLYGHTVMASEDEPMVYGTLINPVWSGPQSFFGTVGQ